MPENLGKVITILATTDFSAATSQYLAMGLDANGKLVLPATNGRIVGTLLNSPNVGQAGSVQLDGITQGIAGAAVAAGDMLMVDAAGKFITFVPGATKYMVGWALEAGAAGGVARFSVLLKTPGSLT
jgi:hypothetical protein